MAIFKCKMCGGSLEIKEKQTIATCEYCGTRQTLPKLDDDRRTNMYNRANHFRRNNEFDMAMGIYEQILSEDNSDAEAYWSLVLCRYGIEYVEDPASHKRIPTINRTQLTSILEDEDYKSAIANADEEQRAIYEKEAAIINNIQKNILAISRGEEPFDVFICYKETDSMGERTIDSVIAQDIYYQLTKENLKVFFARITLEDKLGTAYEPYIFAALNSAKVMIVIGSKPEHFNAPWVRNEWSRYLALVNQSHGEKVLIPACKGMDPYDMPKEFAHLQGQDMDKIGFMQDLIRGIKKLTSKPQAQPSPASATITGSPSLAPMFERVNMFLDDGEFKRADDICEQILNIEPKNEQAYLYKLLAELKIKRREDLAKCDVPFNRTKNFEMLARFASPDTMAEMDGYLAEINDRIEKKEQAEREEAERIRKEQEIKYEEELKRLTEEIKRREEKKKRLAECFRKQMEKIRKPLIISCIAILVISIIVWIFSNIIRGKAEEIYLSGDVAGAAELIDQYGIDYPAYQMILDGDYKAAAEYLYKIIIPNGTTNIPNYAFKGCASLTEVVIPDSVTSIGNSAFKDCTWLRSVVMPEGITSIGNSAFSNCYSLTEIVLPDGVTNIGDYAFSYCNYLAKIVIPDSVTSIGDYAFNGCTSIEYNEYDNALYLGNTNNPYLVLVDVTNQFITSCTIREETKLILNSAFWYCTSLTEIIIPDSVTSIGDSAFSNCTSLTEIIIPHSVTSIGDRAFSYCKLLTEIVIPDSVTSIGDYAFNGCTSLTEIVIPDSVTSIGDSAFRECTSLTDIYYTGTESQWKSISSGNYNSSLTNATIHYNYVP